MGIKFRKMLPEDAAVISEFEKRLFGTCTDEASYKKMCTDEENIYMAAEDNGTVIAYCAITALYETADLCNIAVKEEYRRCHIAEKLLEKCVMSCEDKGVSRILLEARESNAPAICFYKKMGFMEIGKRKKYYKEPCEDAVIMEKIL
ncbi:MAG: ribosomal protein S18-alanine N-acetyltransferase [Lachnospiraceae bacterium]|nr:ribosomal protein S18-alanine N-acetyltransferase [Lachnospiraceae bacterium]